MIRNAASKGGRCAIVGATLFLVLGAAGSLAPAVAQTSAVRPQSYVHETDFVEAVREGDAKKVENMIYGGEKVTAVDSNGTPVLILAVQYNHAAVVNVLLEQGAKPDRRTSDRATALSLATKAGRTEIVRTLLEHGADPNLYGSSQEAPLLIAARSGNSAIAKLLLEHGADAFESDLTGRTARDIALEKRDQSMIELLQMYGNG